LYKWWNNSPDVYEWDYFEKLIDECFYIYVEKIYFRDYGLVFNLKKRRKQRDETMHLIIDIEIDIRKDTRNQWEIRDSSIDSEQGAARRSVVKHELQSLAIEIRVDGPVVDFRGINSVFP
jgi:hypothetical protein